MLIKQKRGTGQAGRGSWFLGQGSDDRNLKAVNVLRCAILMTQSSVSVSSCQPASTGTQPLRGLRRQRFPLPLILVQNGTQPNVMEGVKVAASFHSASLHTHPKKSYLDPRALRLGHRRGRNHYLILSSEKIEMPESERCLKKVSGSMADSCQCMAKNTTIL